MITVCQLYSNLLSTYGDRGNAYYLNYFLRQHGFEVSMNFHKYREQIPIADIYIIGGGQDSSQLIVSQDLTQGYGQSLHELLPNSYCLAICAGYQLLGQYYLASNGKLINGLGYLPVITVAGSARYVGNVVGERKFGKSHRTIVGFENHSGRTYYTKPCEPLMNILKGHGNNGTDRTEGVVYGRTIATYLHGPVLPKNPHLAYWWLKELLMEHEAALRYSALKAERQAHQVMLQRAGM